LRGKKADRERGKEQLSTKKGVLLEKSEESAKNIHRSFTNIEGQPPSEQPVEGRMKKNIPRRSEG